MYNRYTRNDTGVYTRISQNDTPLPGGGPKPGGPPPGPQPPPEPKPPSGPPHRPERDILNRLLEKLHLGDLDSGDLLVLLAQCSYALYIVLFKNFVGRYSPVTIMKWMFTYSFVCLLPFSYDDLIATEWTALERNALLSLGYIVVGSTFLSYILVIVGQKLLRPTVAGMYNYVQPLVASIVAVCWGMDSFNLSKILSVVLIFGGVYLVTMSRSRADEERTAAAGGGAKEA